VLKELCDPCGALIKVSGFQLGDPTLSILELWGAEYQESNALLIRTADSAVLRQMAAREKCPISFVGAVTDDGKVFISSFVYFYFIFSFRIRFL